MPSAATTKYSYPAQPMRTFAAETCCCWMRRATSHPSASRRPAPRRPAPSSASRARRPARALAKQRRQSGGGSLGRGSRDRASASRHSSTRRSLRRRTRVASDTEGPTPRRRTSPRSRLRRRHPASRQCQRTTSAWATRSRCSRRASTIARWGMWSACTTATTRCRWRQASSST